MSKQVKKAFGGAKNKSQSINNKLPEDMQNEIKDAFAFYDEKKSGFISRQNLRSILGNFAFTKMNGKEIEDEISNAYSGKDTFMLGEVMELITKKWFHGRGREEEAAEMFNLFDKKDKGKININDIKNVFNQYLDIVISDADIKQFIEEAGLDKQGYLSQEKFFAKLGYS